MIIERTRTLCLTTDEEKVKDNLILPMVALKSRENKELVDMFNYAKIVDHDLQDYLCKKLTARYAEDMQGIYELVQNKSFKCKLQVTVECNSLDKAVITNYSILINGNIFIETEKDNITLADHYSNFWFMLDEQSQNIFTEMRLSIDREFVAMKEKYNEMNDTYNKLRDEIDKNVKSAESTKCYILLNKLFSKIAEFYQTFKH